LITALAARVEIPRVPPSLNDVLGQPWPVVHRLKKELTLNGAAPMLAHSARAKAGWPLPVKEPAAARYVRITIYRHHRLQDGDNPFVKPLIDACKGALIFDDAPDWCQLVGVPDQVQIPRAEPERTVIEVFLIDPRPVGTAVEPTATRGGRIV
jgi:hypothetical protein